jgi:hypothetical protein
MNIVSKQGKACHATQLSTDIGLGPRVSVLLSVLKKGSPNYSMEPVDKRYIVISMEDNNRL